MENYRITMRIYTRMGKEHVYYIDYYRVVGKTLTVYSNNEEDIFSVIKCGEPCSISLLSNIKLECCECCLDHCSIIDNVITFSSQLDNMVRS